MLTTCHTPPCGSYGPAKKPSESAVNVLTTTIVPAGDGRTIKMDAYAVRYPTNVKDVARVIADITTISVSEKKQLPPILHYQATEAMTKYDSEYNASSGEGKAETQARSPAYLLVAV